MLSGPFTYTIEFDRENITKVTAPDGANKFSGQASRRVPKLYVIVDNGNPIYVGMTRQRIGDRLRQGFQATGSHGYSGYEWRNKISLASVDVWVCDREDQNMMETVEAEVVFQIRSTFGQWPEHQTEIHFHPSSEVHRQEAERVFRRYYKRGKKAAQ